MQQFCFALCNCCTFLHFIMCNATKGRGESESLKLIVRFAPLYLLCCGDIILRAFPLSLCIVLRSILVSVCLDVLTVIPRLSCIGYSWSASAAPTLVVCMLLIRVWRTCSFLSSRRICIATVLRVFGYIDR